jgi:hypothetical protein
MNAESLIRSGNYDLVSANGETYLMESGETDIKKAVGIVNSGDVGLLMEMRAFKTMSANFDKSITIYGVDASGSKDESLAMAIEFVDIASGRIASGKLSIGDLMFLVAMLTLESAKDQRQAIAQDKIAKQLIASDSAAKVFDLKIEAAQEQYEASKLQAISQIVSGSLSVAGGIVQFGFAMSSLSKATDAAGAQKDAADATKQADALQPDGVKQTSKSGDAKPALSPDHVAKKQALQDQAAASQADADQLKAVSQARSSYGQALGQIGSGLGQIAQGSFGIEAAGHQRKADVLRANAELMQVYLQTLQADIGAEQQAYRDTSTQIDQTLQNLKQALQAVIDITQQITRNI